MNDYRTVFCASSHGGSYGAADAEGYARAEAERYETRGTPAVVVKDGDHWLVKIPKSSKLLSERG